MAVRGIDYAWQHVPPAAIKAAGFEFVCRYFSHDPSKNLSKAEADALLAEGIYIVGNWESVAQSMLGGAAAGAADARDADAQATACGLHGTPIYFSADWDATPFQQSAINAYLDGAASVIGHARVGMYGGYWPLSRARAANKAVYWWGTPAWSGTGSTNEWNPQDNPHAFTPHIMQGAGITVGGVGADFDQANFADYGQWPRPAAPPPPVSVAKAVLVEIPAGVARPVVSTDGGKTWH